MASTSLIFMRTFPLATEAGHRLSGNVSGVFSFPCSLRGRGNDLLLVSPLSASQGGENSSQLTSFVQHIGRELLEPCSYPLATAKSQVGFRPEVGRRFLGGIAAGH